MIKVIDMQHA